LAKVYFKQANNKRAILKTVLLGLKGSKHEKVDVFYGFHGFEKLNQRQKLA
jgi:hypothetical protein